jgi:hypothetical protein
MTILFLLIPLFLVPYGVAHLFNRVRVLVTRTGFSYLISILVLGGFAIGFDLITSYFAPPTTAFICRPPTLLLLLPCSPIILLTQYLCNCALIKTVIFDSESEN